MIVTFEDFNNEIIFGKDYPNNTTIGKLVKEAKNISTDRKVKFITIVNN